MIITRRLAKRNWKLAVGLVLAVLVGVFTMVAVQQRANAISNVGPDPNDFAGGIRYVLENTAQLSVTTSYVPIYYPYNPGTVSVSAYSFKFENNPSAHPNVRFTYTNAGGGQSSVKGQSNMSFTVGGFQYDPNTGYFYSLLRADLVDTAGTYPVIYYRLSVPSPGIIGYYAANGRNFAVGNDARCDGNDRSGCGQYHNYSLPFGTQCQATGTITAQAQIYDGDNGNTGVQPTNFSVQVYDETDKTTRNLSPSPSNGDRDGQTATYTFTVQPYHKYRFKVNNVYANNVMQIKLPYDSIYYYSDCRQLEVTDRVYGSWGEYAVMATGDVTGIGAGSAFAGRGLSHATLCSYSFLILSNAREPGTTCKSSPAPTLGNYDTRRTIPDVDGTFPTSSATNTLSYVSGSDPPIDVGTLSGRYRASTNLTLGNGALDKGKSVIINATGHTVTIEGNIAYTTERMNSIDEIPQLVIIADNINIIGAVRQVDAWLVTKGTLNTCSDVAQADLNANNCDRLLTINGPVMAGRALLFRTGGSGNGDASGDPAEIINLRPDAYLWGMSQSAGAGRLQTVYERELPPRF